MVQQSLRPSLALWSGSDGTSTTHQRPKREHAGMAPQLSLFEVIFARLMIGNSAFVLLGHFQSPQFVRDRHNFLSRSFMAIPGQVRFC